jgi:hypothetical protein
VHRLFIGRCGGNTHAYVIGFASCNSKVSFCSGIISQSSPTCTTVDACFKPTLEPCYVRSIAE